MLRPNAWRVAWAVGLLASCDSRVPSPRLTAVQPARAHTDRALRLRSSAPSCCPPGRSTSAPPPAPATPGASPVRCRSAPRSVALQDFAWLGPGQLSATLPSGLPAGRATAGDPRSPGPDRRAARRLRVAGRRRQRPGHRVRAARRPTPPPPRAPGCGRRLTVQDDSGLNEVRWELRRVRRRPDQLRSLPAVARGPHRRCSFELAFPDTCRPAPSVELAVEAIDRPARQHRPGQPVVRAGAAPRRWLAGVARARGHRGRHRGGGARQRVPARLAGVFRARAAAAAGGRAPGRSDHHRPHAGQRRGRGAGAGGDPAGRRPAAGGADAVRVRPAPGGAGAGPGGGLGRRGDGAAGDRRALHRRHPAAGRTVAAVGGAAGQSDGGERHRDPRHHPARVRAG